ncbi:hypothetical protein LINGRAHAP2_LOCUS31501, partial [Linum grandiflorum]
LWIAAFLSSTLDLCSISRSEIASTTPSFQLVTELDYRSKELSSSVQDLSDGHSATRPPRFEGAHFGFWKNQMDLIIQSFYPTLWEIITYRPLDVEKKHGKWTKEEKEKVQLNAQAMNIMYCSLGKEEFNHISNYKSAKEIWDDLIITYEGTTLVKSTKRNMLKQDFELFRMNEGETVKDLINRFQILVNKLDGFGKIYDNEDLVRKILWSLPKEWRPKVTAIEESKKFKDVKLFDLYGSLLTHEEILNREKMRTIVNLENCCFQICC